MRRLAVGELAAATLTVAVVCAGCATQDPRPASPSPTRSVASVRTSPAPSRSADVAPSADTHQSDSQIPVVAKLPLAGKTVGIDPGHNGGNFADPAFINTIIWNGREDETCDTTGTATASGYTEAQFNYNVAADLRADLIAAGARVVMTRHSNNGVGPCVTTRARIINAAHADVAIDIHADGGPASGRGFTVLEPVADGANDKVITSSIAFGSDVRTAMLGYTTMPESNYYGSSGVIVRDDLAGLNLTTVPKVLIECGNMPNSTDAGLLTSPAFQQQLARGFTAAIVAFLTGRPIKKG
jgi:N-acetylmuramoyl-L-alanine amidase